MDDAPCGCWSQNPPLPHEGHCCMTDEGIDTRCHQLAGKAAYEAVRNADPEGLK